MIVFGSLLNTTAMGVLLVIYAVMISYLGYRGFRKTKTSSDYLVAGRSANPFAMAMSYGAAFISTSALVGFGGIAGQFGMGLMWLVFMNIAFGIIVAFVFFGKRTRRIGVALNARTFPEFLGLRYESVKMQYVVAGVIFVFIPLYSSVVLISGARFLQEVMFLPYHWVLPIFAVVVAVYVIFGGLRGVMNVDALIGSIMLFGMLLLLVMCYVKLGGVVSGHKALTDMAPQVLEADRKLGHMGWTVMPKFNSVWWWTLVSSLMLGVGIGALAQPQLAVRFMTVKSDRELHRAVMVGSFFILCTAGAAYMIGSLSNVFFFRKYGKLAIQVAGGNPDTVIPIYIREALPPLALYIFALTMLSAAMSTLSSLFHVTGSSIGYDICGKLRKDGESPLITRAGVAFGIVISLFFAYILPPGVVARGTAIFFGICAAAFLPAYTAALYWKGATRAGAWWSIAVGTGVSLFGLVFLHRKEAAMLGICKWIFGKTELISAHPWPFVDPFVYALPLSLLTLIVVSLCTAKPCAEHLDRCFRDIK